MRLVSTSTEELPWFATEKNGSLVHANGLALGEKRVVACVSLETIGCTATHPEASAIRFPSIPLLRLRAISSASSQSPLLKSFPQVIVQFRTPAAFPSEGAVGWSRSRGELVRPRAYWNFGWAPVDGDRHRTLPLPATTAATATHRQARLRQASRAVLGLEMRGRELMIAAVQH